MFIIILWGEEIEGRKKLFYFNLIYSKRGKNNFLEESMV